MKKKHYLLHILLGFLLVFAGPVSFSQVTVTSSDSLSCVVPCTTLTAHLVGDTPTDAGVSSDDIYSSPHAIGFTFNYYGIDYTQCVLGANGTIDFTLSDAGLTDNWQITGPLLGNPYKYNNICGPWCDIDIFFGPPTGTETYSTDGVAPFRKFSVTWCGCSMYECPSQLTTSQIILYETTNIIEVHIAQKLICTSWNPSSPPGAGGRAIVGVQNATGTAATTAPGRDFPAIWSNPPHEAWRFTPVGGGTSYTVAPITFAPIPYASSAIYWYNATTGAYLGTGDTITVCPPTTTTYKAGALGCGADTSFGYYTVTTTGSLTITTTFTNPTLCGDCNGTISIHGLTPGRLDTINYQLGGVAQPPVIAVVSPTGTITITGLCAGVYSNIIATQGSCSSLPAGPVTLTDPGISISSVTPTNPSACGVCDGILVLNGLYPGRAFTVNYNFYGVAQPPISTFSSGTGTITLTGLCAGVYNNIVASFGSCITPPVGPYTLTAPPPPPVFLTASVNPSQCGYCDGSITIHALPPLAFDTIFYSLNGVAQTPVVVTALPDSTLHLTGLCVGSYTALSVKVGPCLTPVIGTATLTAPAIAASFTQSVHWGCHGDTVSFTNLSSYVAPLYYVWNFGDGYTDTATNPTHIFAQGVYTVTLAATNHYCTVLFALTDSLIHPLQAVFNDSPGIICQNNAVNFTDKSVGTDLSYAWHFGNGATGNGQTPSYTYANTGVYKVTEIITDFVPCHDTAYATVQVDSLSPIKIIITDSVLCRSTAVTFTGNYSSIGNTGISWQFGDGDSVLNLNPVQHSYDGIGTYTVTATAYYRACKDPSAARVVNLFLSPSVYLGQDTSICPGSEAIILSSQGTASDPGIKWKWSTGATTPTIGVTAPGIYWVDAILNGCGGSDTIQVLNDCYMNIPNVFTPNGDGMNDYFYPRQYLTKGLTSFTMNIYNRWGQLIFSSESIDGAGWDGKYNNVEQPVGVYIYMIDATFKDGQRDHRQGNITLLR